MTDQVHTALIEFAKTLTAKFKALTHGEPEDQLKAPVEALLKACSQAQGRRSLVVKGEASIQGIGRPDMAVELSGSLVGHVELKAPGKGADAPRFKKKDHDGQQWGRFSDLPNLVYTDGQCWALYHSGERSGSIVRLMGDPSQEGAKALGDGDAERLAQLLANFFSWDAAHIVPKKPRQLAAFLAPYTRLLREAVSDALEQPGEIANVRKVLKYVLFPDATDAQFADAYAQTILFGLLMARARGADVTSLEAAHKAISSKQTLLDDILRGLTDEGLRAEIGPALEVAQRVLAAIPPELMASREDDSDPWLFFYEDFLAAYDPKLRKESGAYYTPVQVVRSQVRLLDEVLNVDMGRQGGFMDPSVSVLDPAVGTGTYPLAVLDRVVETSQARWGHGAVAPAIGGLIQRMFGFEIMVGPYAVTQLRLALSAKAYDVGLPPDGVGVYLTNSLEDPKAPAPDLPLWGIQKEISQEHERALSIKDLRRIIAILGNPPYGRHDKATKDNKAVTGSWVRWGSSGPEAAPPILEDFLRPAREAGHGKHLKNLYNQYVYFIRWALWKAFEHRDAKDGPGVVSFITASSYLDGDAFSGLREHMRRECDTILILDLGGEGRGTHQDDNVFDIQTPVAIFVAWRRDAPDRQSPALVRYARIEGTRAEKYAALDALTSRNDISWEDAPNDWQAPFKPAATGPFATWPLLTDIMPWQHSGSQYKRTWPIAPTKELLSMRWQALLSSDDQAVAFKESRDRKIEPTRGGQAGYPDPCTAQTLPWISTLPTNTAPKAPVRYGYRSFDRMWCLPDGRLGDYLRTELWQAHSNRQLYLSSVFTTPLSSGPALTAAAHIPDLHHFRGSYGAADQFPLYRDAEAVTPNLAPELLPLLEATYGTQVSPDDVAAYLYANLAHPAYQQQHEEALLSKELRVPFTKNPELFAKAVHIGKHLLWLQTYGERFSTEYGTTLPQGKAQCRQAVTGRDDDYPDAFSYDDTSRDIVVGEGDAAGRFGPVDPEVWSFEVSGFAPVQSWLGYRMKNRKGKKSSPLDDIGPTEWSWEFTSEFLQLLWVLEHTLAAYPEQAELLDAIESGPVFLAEELPEVPDAVRKPPRRKTTAQGDSLFDARQED